MLENYLSALESDKPDMTKTEKLMAQNAQTARGATMLIMAEVARSGFVREVDSTFDLAPGAKELAKFLTAERGALMAIGMERRSRPTQTLEAYIVSLGQASAADSQSFPSTRAKPPRVRSDPRRRVFAFHAPGPRHPIGVRAETIDDPGLSSDAT